MIFEPFSRARHGGWVKENVECVFCDDMRGVIAIRDEFIVGAMIADSWTYTSVQVHNAITDPICFKHGIHIKFADYVFNTCGRSQMIGLVPSDNKKALKLNLHYGFKEVTRLPDAYRDGVDYVIMRLLKSECKYLTTMSEAA